MLFKKTQLPTTLLLNKPEIEDRITEPENVGVDIALSTSGDLALNSKGDIELLTPDQSITISLLRRVLTPPGGYSRVFLEQEQLVEYGSELENVSYSYLSSNKTSILAQELLLKLKELAELDERIEIIDIKLKPSGATEININLNYRTKGSNVLKTLIYQYK